MFDTKSRWVWASFALISLSACSSSAPAAPEDSDVESSESAEQPGDPTTGSKTGKDAGTRDGGAKDTGTRDGGAKAVERADGIPCEVSKIVASRCATCHSSGDEALAPFPLEKLADFQAKLPFDESRTAAEAAHEVVTATDVRSRMPPASAPQLTEDEIETFAAWLAGGAKAGTSCSTTSGSDAGATRQDAGAPTSAGGGASSTEVTYDDPDVKCYKLTAYATPADKTQKYSVPTTPDLYTAFNVKAPWTGTQYIRSFKSVIDNSQVLHHWLLFRQLNGGQEQVVPNVLGAHPDGEMLYGWAPGGDNMWFDEDVGMAVPAGSVFQLEMHYNNRTGRPSPDASGVEVCVTPNKPAHIAGLSWVGTDAINGTTAVGNCTHASKQKIRLVASQPHMHTKGTHMKVDLTRAAGGVTTIHDQPFDFNFQRAYIHNIDINPGDRLTTTCTYSSPARFGKRTSDEMCYFFSIHWPAGALSRSNISSLIHGPNTCID